MNNLKQLCEKTEVLLACFLVERISVILKQKLKLLTYIGILKSI